MPIATRKRMKRAFTILELISVIVVIGILASAILPRLQDDRLERVATQILQHIRYTQHLAIVDSKFNPAQSEWYKERWQIRFFQKKKASAHGDEAKWAYAVFSDKDAGSGYDGNPNATTGEVAKDPTSGKIISGGFTIDYNDSRTFRGAAIGETYNIVDVKFTSTCSVSGSKRVIFDHLGRPLFGNPKSYTTAYPNDRILRSECNITFCIDQCSDKNFTITIEPETGYTYISARSP